MEPLLLKMRLWPDPGLFNPELTHLHNQHVDVLLVFGASIVNFYKTFVEFYRVSAAFYKMSIDRYLFWSAYRHHATEAASPARHVKTKTAIPAGATVPVSVKVRGIDQG